MVSLSGMKSRSLSSSSDVTQSSSLLDRCWFISEKGEEDRDSRSNATLVVVLLADLLSVGVVISVIPSTTVISRLVVVVVVVVNARALGLAKLEIGDSDWLAGWVSWGGIVGMMFGKLCVAFRSGGPRANNKTNGPIYTVTDIDRARETIEKKGGREDRRDGSCD